MLSIGLELNDPCSVVWYGCLYAFDVLLYEAYTLYQFCWKEKKLVHAMWETIEQKNDQKVCAVSPTVESMKPLEKLPVCQDL